MKVLRPVTCLLLRAGQIIRFTPFDIDFLFASWRAVRKSESPNRENRSRGTSHATLCLSTFLRQPVKVKCLVKCYLN